jgi:4'-phosphopantetheinyl transferase EntD
VTVLEEPIEESGGSLLPAEAALVANAVASRRSEFAAGRALARRALASLGVPQAELAADQDGVPVWPRGFTGCITHAAGRVAVAVASSDAVGGGIGIDMEAVARFHRDLEPLVLSTSEIRLHLAGSTGAERQARTAVLFCAKEAWFKCQFPLTGRRLGFLDTEIDVDWDSGHFFVQPRASVGLEAGTRGRGAVHGGIARAAIVRPPGRLTLDGARPLPGAR